MMVSSKRFGRLVHLTKQACDQLAVVVREVYKTADDMNELKDDDSVFTIADGLVQEMLQTYLFKNGEKFQDIVGEEEESNINITQRPYTVSNLTIPEKLFDRIDQTKRAITKLGEELDGFPMFQDCTIFIDPIDGTREFSTRLGEQCTILIGFAREGHPVAGVVYRPIPDPPCWAIGCKEEGLADQFLDMEHKLNTTTVQPHPNGLLTTNGRISNFTEAFLAELSKNANDDALTPAQLRIKAGGVGNKLMNMLERKGECYIQDRGVSRWDTCAAQAVIEARGGVLCKLSPFIERKELESYTYRKTEVNLDFSPQVPTHLTKHNSARKLLRSDSYASAPEELKPYANVCGLLALDASAIPKLDTYHAMLLGASKVSPPSYD